MEELNVEDARWPFVIVRATITPTLERAAALHETLGGLFARRDKFGFVFDTRGSGVPDAKVRKALAESRRAHHDNFKRYVTAGATVVDSAVMKGVLTAIEWIAPPPFESANFTDFEAAVAWVKARLPT